MTDPATVLVVDDEQDITTLMRDFLEAAGYRVLTAPDGQAALATLETNDVDCILLDIMMPGLSGFDVLRRIRETRDVPVLFLTAKDEDSDKIRGLGLGGDDYIVKSATPGEIVARVTAVLRRTRRDDPAAATGTLEFGRLSIDPRARARDPSRSPGRSRLSRSSRSPSLLGTRRAKPAPALRRPPPRRGPGSPPRARRTPP